MAIDSKGRPTLTGIMNDRPNIPKASNMPNTHFILMLDSSGSMGELPEGWTREDVREYIRRVNTNEWDQSNRKFLTIAGKGGSPGQPYDAPKEDPNNPYVPAPKRFTV